MDKLAAACDEGTSGKVDIETEWLNLGLDIIGLGVFNYQFGSITSESPVIKVRTVANGIMLHNFTFC